VSYQNNKMNKTCIIGNTGFVGCNLTRERYFSHKYNSKNISKITEESFDQIICAGLPAEKWIANLYPCKDKNNTNLLIDKLKKVKTCKFILISTVDVYEKPFNCNELSENNYSLNTYGKNRKLLEDFVKNYFQSYIIIRLPALFGDGLKKNALYDLLNNNEPEKIIGENEYQWYNINWLNQDINLLLENDFHGLINFCSQPISMISIINENNIKLKINLKAPPTILYDVNSIHSKYFNLNYDYKYTHNINNVRDCLNSFIKNYRV